MDFLNWLENTPVSQWLASDPYANLVLLCCHAVGMGLVVGICWILSIRVLGYPRGLSLQTFESLARLAGAGFILNAASGVLLFCAAATRLIINTDFQLKMACIVLAGLSVWALDRSLATLDKDDPTPRFSTTAKVAAVACALLWIGAIVSGRYIAYTLARPAL